jgi:hypothetical protein
MSTNEYRRGDRVQDLQFGGAGRVVHVYPPGEHLQVIRVRWDNGAVAEMATQSVVPEGTIPRREWWEDY